MSATKPKSELFSLMNVGKAIHADLIQLKIYSITSLSTQEPDQLYLKLQKITHSKQAPCVWDVFAAIIHEARTGAKTPWWHWTPVRKKRQAAGTFCTTPKKK